MKYLAIDEREKRRRKTRAKKEVKKIDFAIEYSAQHVHGTANRQPEHTHFFHFEIHI